MPAQKQRRFKKPEETRRFGGKVFHLWTTTTGVTNKGHAESMARKLREKGHLARVVYIRQGSYYEGARYALYWLERKRPQPSRK